LVIFCPKLIAKNKNILIFELTFTIINHELPFMVALSISYCYNNDNNNSSEKLWLQWLGSKFFKRIIIEKHRNQSRFKCCNGPHNSVVFHCKNNGHVPFFKPPLKLNLDSKIFNLNIQPFLEHVFMHLNLKGLNMQGDRNQAYSVK
jgi:hypothetical protein